MLLLHSGSAVPSPQREPPAVQAGRAVHRCAGRGPERCAAAGRVRQPAMLRRHPILGQSQSGKQDAVRDGAAAGPGGFGGHSARRTHNETYLSEEGCGVHNDNTEDHEVVVEMYAGAVCAIEDEAVRLQVIK